MLLVSHKVAFIKNEAVLHYAQLCGNVQGHLQLLLQSSVFVVHFSNTFWHENEAFPKGSS